MSARVRTSVEGGPIITTPIISGRIIAGMKKPTAKALQVPGVADAYQQGVDAGATWDEIDIACKAVKGAPSYPLRPANSPCFFVAQSHWTIPGAAQKIMEEYGTKRPGDSASKLYGFPILFGSESFDEVFPEQFQAWKASRILRWSQEGRCMSKEDLKPDPNRKKRWGGVPDQDLGACKPNDCPMFHEGTCNHVAHLYFRLPVINGVGLIDLRFNSVLAAGSIFDCLTSVKNAIGHISGLHQGNPIFQISKREVEFSRLDWKTGERTRQTQFLITLEAPGVNFMSYLLDHEGQPSDVPQITSDDETNHPPNTDLSTGEVIEPKPEPKPEPAPKPEPEPEPEPEPAPQKTSTAMSAPVKRLRKKLDEIRVALEWSSEDMKEWVGENYPDPGATKNEASLQEMVDKLSALKRLRKKLDETRVALEWSSEDMKEWVGANYPDPGATKNEASLQEMVDKLSALKP